MYIYIYIGPLEGSPCALKEKAPPITPRPAVGVMTTLCASEQNRNCHIYIYTYIYIYIYIYGNVPLIRDKENMIKGDIRVSRANT